MAKFTGARRTLLLHPFFISVGGTLLMAALFTDYMYFSSSLMQWSNFSAWLITGGLVFALLSVVFLLLDLALRRAGSIRWPDLILVGTAAILSLVNVFVHTRDAWTSVVPTGIALSVITTPVDVYPLLVLQQRHVDEVGARQLVKQLEGAAVVVRAGDDGSALT